jgi:hypothetical protein
MAKELGVDAVVEEGHYGELSVHVDGEEVINGGALAFPGVVPSLRRIRDAVAATRSPPQNRSASSESPDA